MWRALRTINSQHEAWKHLPANGSVQQDSQLRVENTTAAKAKAATEPVKPQLANGHSKQESKESQAQAESMTNGVHADSQGASEESTNAVGKINGIVPNGKAPNGKANPFESKIPKAGQMKEDKSGSGEIKAHNESVDGKHSMAVL